MRDELDAARREVESQQSRYEAAVAAARQADETHELAMARAAAAAQQALRCVCARACVVEGEPIKANTVRNMSKHHFYIAIKTQTQIRIEYNSQDICEHNMSELPLFLTHD